MKVKKRILSFLKEIIIIVIGVLIAVSIGNYKEKIDNEAYVEKILLTIENEIELSHNEVDNVLKKHLAIVEALETDDDADALALGEMIGSLGGIQFPSIKNVGLRFFVSNKAELVEFQLISQLLDIEDHSNTLSSKMTRLADFAYEHINDEEDEAKITFAFLLADVIDSEQALLELYADFLNKGN
jgi:hypothetical protein